MNEHQMIIEQKQKRRYQLLLELWKAVEGREHKNVDFMLVAKNAGFEESEAKEIYNYFMNEGFFSNRIVVWIVSLSHRAIVEIENSITQPTQATEHFPPTVIQHFHSQVGSVQTGANSTAYVNQNIGGDISEILQIIEKLREQFNKLPYEENQEAIDVIDALSEEVKSPQPNKGRVKAFLTAAKSFATDVTSSTLATTLAEAIAKGLGIS